MLNVVLELLAPNVELLDPNPLNAELFAPNAGAGAVDPNTGCCCCWLRDWTGGP